LQGILPEYKAAVVGVFDGHGHSGHLVSQFVRDAVTERLKEALDEAETKPRTVGSWTTVLDKVFTRVDQALLEETRRRGRGQRDDSCHGCPESKDAASPLQSSFQALSAVTAMEP